MVLADDGLMRYAEENKDMVSQKVFYVRRWYTVISKTEETRSELQFDKLSHLKGGRKRHPRFALPSIVTSYCSKGWPNRARENCWADCSWKDARLATCTPASTPASPSSTTACFLCSAPSSA